MLKVQIARGSQAAYAAINPNTFDKYEDTIFLITDTHNIYLGANLIFEEDAFKDVEISGKTVTFTTHGAAGTTGTKTLNLNDFATSSEVAAAIASAISSAYKPSGTIAKSGIVSGLLVEANQGNVYNVSEAFTVGSGSGQVPASLFVDAVAGNSYPAGTNIVVINSGTASDPSYKFDVLSGFVDLSGYATKVSGATAGNFAALDANGNLTDSGHKHDDYKTKQAQRLSPAASGNAVAFIDTISQDTNGVITATKKTVRSASASLSGLMSAGHYSKLEGIESGAEVNVLEAVQLNGSDLTIDANKKVNINTETAYNASSNKIATMADVADASLEWIEL